ncbi:SDR family oxidoreductase [Fundicoccus culcitae]|uniref:SDR family oxidoreductase n=1 Tax=Fundicoccus culcitae TaxID=2969821 RepID=A0ABY5P9N7_9LACT|nr:SDR family oxidoreductase [Fundicoccus culcitae]UUX35070.1 SDR family oxidoreductase [Fundicoccus culcitae]
MELNDKVVIITGASSGIGAATAELLIEKGARLVLGARRVDKLADLANKYPDANVVYQQTDVTKFEDLEDLVQLAKERFGRVDVLFNNAGIMPTAPLVDRKLDEWQQMLDTNIMGVLHGIAAVLPTMVEQQSGHIIATDSVAGHVVYPNSAVYCGTKFAVRAIMEGLRQEQKDNNIKSTIISPGTTDTELYQTINDAEDSQMIYKMQKEIGIKPQDIAKAVVYAIDTPAEVTISDMIIRASKQSV